MSWQPNGRYYSFTPEVIRSCVPPSSGVYGLFNFNYQLFIGESENIQEALLRHRSDSDLQSRRYRPTGFTFQVYSADLRQRKATELIEKFRPVRQTAKTEPLPPPVSPSVNELPLGDLDHSQIDQEEFSMHERESLPAAQPRYYFKRAQGVALMALFAGSMAASFYLGMLTGENLQRQANLDSEKTLARMPVMPSPAEHVQVDPDERGVAANDVSGDLSVHIPGWMPTSMETAIDTTAADKPVPSSMPGSPAGGAAAQHAGSTLARSPSITTAPGSVEAGKKWSVQISAAPARQVADALAEQLKSVGYDGYVVQAEVKGQTYYRVRVGHFAAQEEAESLRQSLARQERYPDAFLVND